MSSTIIARFNTAWLDAGEPTDVDLPYTPSRTAADVNRSRERANASRHAGCQHSIDAFLDKARVCRGGHHRQQHRHWRIASALDAGDLELAQTISGRDEHLAMIRVIDTYRVPTADDLVQDNETFTVPD